VQTSVRERYSHLPSGGLQLWRERGPHLHGFTPGTPPGSHGDNLRKRLSWSGSRHLEGVMLTKAGSQREGAPDL
jgi:hypothetical protein